MTIPTTRAMEEEEAVKYGEIDEILLWDAWGHWQELTRKIWNLSLTGNDDDNDDDDDDDEYNDDNDNDYDNDDDDETTTTTKTAAATTTTWKYKFWVIKT